MIWTRSGRLPMFAATNSASAFTAASRALVSGFSAVSFLASALAAALFIGSFCLLLWRERLASTSLAARRFGALLLRHWCRGHFLPRRAGDVLHQTVTSVALGNASAISLIQIF